MQTKVSTVFVIAFVSLCISEARAQLDMTLPPPGVHPRLYFNADDLPRIKTNLLTSDHGKVVQKIMDQVRREMTPELTAFAALDLSHPDAGTIQKYFVRGEARNIRWGLLTLDAVVHDDAPLKQLMIGVITNYARIILASKELGVGGDLTAGTGDQFRQTLNVWKTNDFNVATAWLFGGNGFPLSYDLLFNDMTPDQRDTVRRALAAATTGRRSFGADEPKGRAFSNWYGYHGELAVMLAAIDREEGYDDAAFQRIARTLQNYFEISFAPDGSCHEDGYGPNLGLRAGSLGLMVLARHGMDELHTPRYQNFIRWFAQELEPSRNGAFVGGASGTSVPYPTSVIVAKYLYPADPSANYIYRYVIGDDYQRTLPPQCWLDFALFGTDWQGDKTQPPDLAATGAPLAVFYPWRGKLIARSDFSQNALMLHFDARPDAFAIGHDTVDRGTFEISALARPWAVHQAFRDTQNSTDFSLIHIDGKAEPYKATSVKFLWHDERSDAAGGAADLKYAYDWQWTPPWPSKDDTFPAPWEHEMSDPRTLGWPDDPDWLPHKIWGEEGIGHIGSYMWRRPFNPVQKAFRTAALVRGSQPYVLIVDDIKKDDQPHVYDWYMQLAPDVIASQIAGRDVILADPKDDRRLLVRAIGADGFTGAKVEAYTFQSVTPTSGMKKGNRLVISATSVEPRFKILIVPFRKGEPLPATELTADATHLLVHRSDSQEAISFKPDAAGCSILKIARTSGTILGEGQ
jgi:hypothetical protein